jgi:hypothetical protein
MKMESEMRTAQDYLTTIPKTVPEGRVVVHNHVRPARRLGTRGFRAWLAEPSADIERCDCGWAPELGAHYRVRNLPAGR